MKERNLNENLCILFSCQYRTDCWEFFRILFRSSILILIAVIWKQFVSHKLVWSFFSGLWTIFIFWLFSGFGRCFSMIRRFCGFYRFRPREESAPVSSSICSAESPCDLLGSIFQSQQMLHMKTEKIKIHRDGIFHSPFWN